MVGTPSRARFQGLARSILVSGLLPFAIYTLLNPRLGSVGALVCAAVPPAVDALAGLVRRRRADPISVLVLAGIILGIASSFIAGSERMLLVGKSLITAAFGLGYGATLLFPRPALFYIARHVVTGGEPAGIAEWEEFWTYPRFRADMRWMTIVWTFGLLAEAATRAALAFSMSIGAFLLVWPFIDHGITAALIVWSIRYGRRMERQAEALQAAAQE